MKKFSLATARIVWRLMAGWSGLPAALGGGRGGHGGGHAVAILRGGADAGAMEAGGGMRGPGAGVAGDAAGGGRVVRDLVAGPAGHHRSLRAGLFSRGHQPGFGPYGAQMDRAIDFVISCQKPDGLFSYEAPAADDGMGFMGGAGRRGALPRRAMAGTYNHAIAGLMLGEVFGHANAQRTKEIKQAMDKALQFTRAICKPAPRQRPRTKEGGAICGCSYMGRRLGSFGDGLALDVFAVGAERGVQRAAKIY